MNDSPSRRRWFLVGLGALFALAALAGPLLLVTRQGSAQFSAAERIGVNRAAAATVDVTVGEASTSFEIVDLAPGDRATASFDVVNDGTLRLRYAVTSSAADTALGRALRWTMWEADRCETAPVDPVLDGAPLVGADDVVGDPATGRDPGDRVLRPDAAERWCLAVELPLAVGDDVQGLTTTQQFTVHAEQFPEEES